MSLEKLREWVGKTQTVEDLITSWPVRALTATFDEKDPPPRPGDPLPPLWHWLFFLEAVPQSRIGPDGHAERGEFLPPVPLPRRMWAGSRFAFDGLPLSIGDTVVRRSEIKSIEPKTGSSGDMVFVTVRHSVSGSRGHSFVEEHDIVYREGREARRDTARAQACSTRCHMVETAHARSSAAVSLLRPHLQRPSHPLRSTLCHRQRRISRSDRARTASRYAAIGVGAPLQCRQGA
jgi:hydroxyacyl-ACP dehydratase HTD2-like protein with hotdog domain